MGRWTKIEFESVIDEITKGLDLKTLVDTHLPKRSLFSLQVRSVYAFFLICCGNIETALKRAVAYTGLSDTEVKLYLEHFAAKEKEKKLKIAMRKTLKKVKIEPGDDIHDLLMKKIVQLQGQVSELTEDLSEVTMERDELLAARGSGYYDDHASLRKRDKFLASCSRDDSET